MHPGGSIAYFTRETQDEGTMDIWQFELPPYMRPSRVSYIDGLVFDNATNLPLSAQIEVFALEGDDSYSYISGSDGSFIAALSHGRAYGIHVSAPGYAFYSARFEVDEEPYSRKAVRSPLEPLQVQDSAKPAPIILNNVEFEFGSTELTSASRPELDRLKDLLITNPAIEIEIRGHTDNVGDPDSNLQLSKGRAKALFDWLVAGGVDASRLSYMGYGEEVPIADNTTDEGRQRNRRTEFLILTR